MIELLNTLVFWAGLSLIALSIGSLAIPKLLNWSEATQSLPQLIRQIFWTYAIYILGMNLFFGIVATASPQSLTDGSFLASALSLYISIYWLGRIFIQIFYFDKSDVPSHWIFTVGEILLFVVFCFVTVVFSWAFYHNIS
jgi:hypothetical protein